MIFYQDATATLYHGDSLQVLQSLPDQSVQCCVTSPPYWALRDYGVDGQMGLEDTPEQFVASMVELFREVRRVLRDDGTLWLNIGDSYAAKPSKPEFDFKDGRANRGHRKFGGVPIGYKPKDLVGVPWLLAFAMRSDGWYLRQDIIWQKKSPMPESVRDRCTKAHEYIFLFSKSARYFYDAVGSQEQTTGGAHHRGNGLNPKARSIEAGNHRERPKQNESFSAAVANIVSKRNMRSVWSLASFPLKQAHFAAYPPELVRRCLSAGISEKGCCATCGRPLERITEKVRVQTRLGTNAKQHFPSNMQSGKGSHNTIGHNSIDSATHPKNWKSDNYDAIAQRSELSPNRDPYRHVTETVTTGWKPGCKCDIDENLMPVPCTVLDPFSGAGTTWKVCQRLGLRYIGIDLNADYLQLSVDRPAVHFPHERKKPRARRVRKIITPMLEGLE